MTHEGRHHHAVRGGRLVAVLILNACITIAEYIGGFLSGSLALVSDAGHNLSDVLAIGLGYAGEKISSRPPGKRFSFGLKRFEVAAALTNALVLVVIAAWILREAALRFFHPSPVNAAVMLPIACIGLAGNLASIIILARDRARSLNLKAAFMHLFADTISSVAVIAAGIALVLTGLPIIDLAISALIAVMIAAGATGIIRDAARIFLQGTPPHIDPAEVLRDIASTRGAESVHGLHIWSINSSEVFLSCHICASGADTDRLIRSVNRMLEDRYGIRHTAIQVETQQICSFEGDNCCR